MSRDRRPMTEKEYVKALKQAKARIVKQGPCAFCGGRYARHRLIDAQMDRVMAGEDTDECAADWDMTGEQMVMEWRALMDLYQEAADAVPAV